MSSLISALFISCANLLMVMKFEDCGRDIEREVNVSFFPVNFPISVVL